MSKTSFLLLSSFYHEAQSATYPFGYGLSMQNTSYNPSSIGGIEEAQSNASRKPFANFSFKLTAVDLSFPSQSIPSTSKDSPLGFERFLGRNPFDLRTNHSTFSYFSHISTPFLVENPCFWFCSFSPSTSEPRLLRLWSTKSPQSMPRLLKSSSVGEPAGAPSSTAGFCFFFQPSYTTKIRILQW